MRLFNYGTRSRNNFVYASVTTCHGDRLQGIYTWDEFHDITFSPDTTVNYMTDFKAKTKEEARDIAISVLDSDRATVDANGECLSYGEYSIIGENLRRLAKRFGLVREFKENAII